MIKNKISTDILNKMKTKVSELKNDKIEKEDFVEEKYVSKINYDELDVDSKTVCMLIKYEEKVVRAGNEIRKNLAELGKAFQEANTLLSNKKNGTFCKWYEKLGFKKDFIYMCLKRNSLYLELEDYKVYEIPDKAIKEISKLKDTNPEILKNIINSDKPLETIKKITSVKPKLFSNNEHGEFDDIKSLKNKIKNLEKELSKLKKILKDKEEGEENKNNLKIEIY